MTWMMKMLNNLTFFIVCLLTLYLLYVKGETDFWQNETILRRQMLDGYDKTVRPSLNVSVLIKSLEVDAMEVKEDDHTLLLHGALQLTWGDSRLKWSLEDHEDLDRLGFDPQELWLPDLAMYSPFSTNRSPLRSHVPALVYPDGGVLFVPPVDLSLTCLPDLTYWPYDMLSCSLRSGSWVHHGHMLNLTLDEDVLKFMLSKGEGQGSSSSTIKPEWEVVFANLTREMHHLPCCSEPQPVLMLSVVLRRSAPAITWIMKTPLICLYVMTCLVFLLPPNGSGKVVFGSVCVLLNTLFFVFVTSIVYRDPMHTPLIVQLVMHQLVLTVVSVVLAVVVVRLAKSPHSYPLPHFLKRLINALCPLQWVSNCTKRVVNQQQEYAVIVKSDQIELGESNCAEANKRDWPEDAAAQWLLLATVTDRLALVLYLAAVTVTLIRFYPVL